MPTHEVDVSVGALAAGETAVWDLYHDLLKKSGWVPMSARIAAVLMENNSASTITERQTQRRVLSGTAPKIAFPFGARQVVLDAASGTSAGDVRLIVTVEWDE